MIRSMNSLLGTLAPAALTLLVACGGAHHDTAKDPGPDYANPVTPGWSFQKNLPLSSGRHLVLDLVGPANQSGLGVALTLDLGTDAGKATWAPVQPGDPNLVKNLAFDLGHGSHALKASAKGGLLQLGVFAKNRVTTLYGPPLIQIALDLKEDLKAGDTISLVSRRANELTPAGVRPIAIAVNPVQAK